MGTLPPTEVSVIPAHLTERKMLSSQEAAFYLSVSLSHLYKLTSGKRLRYYKPSGKKIYFDVEDLDSYLRTNPVASNEEVELASATLVTVRRAPSKSTSLIRGRKKAVAAR